MKVVLASRLFAPEVAAAAFRLRALTMALAEAGHGVTVLTTRAPADSGPEPETGARVRRWPVLRDRNGTVRGYVQYASFDIPLALRLLAQPADMVVCEPPPSTGVVAAVVCGLRRIPLYYYAADVWSDALVASGAPRPVIAVMRMLERIVLRRASGVLAVSDGVAERVVALGAAPDRVEVVSNGIDTEVFAPSVGDQSAPDPVLVYTGTMSEWQGADVFIRALPEVRRRCPGARIVFLGQGSAESELRELAERLVPGAVEFGGVVPPAEAARTLRSARGALVSIVPGRGYDFARPTKIYAATGCGTPVLFAGAGDGAALVRNNELGLVSGHDPAEVADRMVELLSRTAFDSARLVSWTEEHASLRSTGRRAARWITGVRDERSAEEPRNSRRAA
ncbi:glycosyltransferase family 4 protein [Pseudonocardia parietis]|uniref:Glycosyltransferase involved in cell wall biosynthesis n=1 Tax=Pseudonocardia parietis TaxID=570936 RepID=A0ABS4VLB3_9PSEU|nr:glycosyltransferase family 4 protein [Pseudonocardia parietis]MBP2364682.1 glycosyltransferase involved in cell wall biosynthesis [Pseudonocardia parietis]